jgi:hypothetical protein
MRQPRPDLVNGAQRPEAVPMAIVAACPAAIRKSKRRGTYKFGRAELAKIGGGRSRTRTGLSIEFPIIRGKYGNFSEFQAFCCWPMRKYNGTSG